MDASIIRPPPAPRVLPLLLESIVNQSPQRQKLHLTLFLEHIDNFVAFADTTDEEIQELLLFLFSVVQRREGITPFMQRLHVEVSDLAFHVLYRLLAVLHGKTTTVHEQLIIVMERLGCGMEALHARAEGPPPKVVLPNPHTPPDPLVLSDDDTDEVEFAPELPEIPASLVPINSSVIAAIDGNSTVTESSSANFEPLIYSLDCLDDDILGELTDATFSAMEEQFNALDLNGNKTLTIQEFQKISKFGDRVLACVSFFRDCDKDKSGDLDLAEVIAALYPDVPFRFIERRVKGVTIPDDPKTYQIPERRLKFAVRTPRERASRKLLNLQERLANVQVRGKEFKDVCHYLKVWFDSIDVDRTGELTMDEVQNVGGKLGVWSVDHTMFTKLDKDHSGTVSFYEFVTSLYPAVPEDLRKHTVDEVIAASRAQWTQRLQNKKQEDSKWKTIQIQPLPDQKPATQALRNMLKVREDVIRTAQEKFEERQRQKAARRREHQKTVDEYEHLVRMMEEYDAMMDRKSIPLEIGAPMAPKVIPFHGVALSASFLELDCFLHGPLTRNMACEMFRVLDRSGVPVRFLLHSAASLHQYLPRAMSEPGKVFRDFLVCPPRPSAGRHWNVDRDGAQQLHIKTNITIRSDVKYRFHIEGFNFGVNKIVNSVVVGYAGRQWGMLDNQEEYGWPEGWDKHTCVHFSRGIDRIDQYFSRDECVCLQLEAKLFTFVGFSVSAWLVSHGFGTDYPLTATIHHQQERL